MSADHCIKLKEHKQLDKYLDLTRELKKIMVYEGDSDTNNSSIPSKRDLKRWKNQMTALLRFF